MTDFKSKVQKVMDEVGMENFLLALPTIIQEKIEKMATEVNSQEISDHIADLSHEAKGYALRLRCCVIDEALDLRNRNAKSDTEAKKLFASTPSKGSR